MKQIPVSVIIPAFNHERYVGPAIESVLAQTFGDFELIIIDDASQDSTPDIISRYKDERITFIQRKENKGSCATINECIKKSSGDFISILNSDDVYHRSRLERLVEEAAQSGAAFVATDLELIDSEGDIVKDKSHWWIEWYEGLESAYESSKDIVQGLFLGNFIITTSNFFVKRSVFEHVGLFYDYRYTLDYEFIMRFLSEYPSEMAYLNHEKLLYYRLHETNTIREDPITPNQETRDMLLQWFPSFLSGPDKNRSEALIKQLRKVIGHIESETKLKIEEECRKLHEEFHSKEKKLHEMLREKDAANIKLYDINYKKDIKIQYFSDQITMKDAEMKSVLLQKEQEIELLKMSLSFRLGRALLTPFRMLKRN